MLSIKEHNYVKDNLSLQNILGQSLWYSRCSILSVSLMSGFGLPWNHNRAKVEKWFNITNNEDIKHTIPENITLLRAIYKKGEPHYCNTYNENERDYHNYLWDDLSFKKVISPTAQSYLIMDEIILAKYFNDCSNNEFSIKESLLEKKAISVLLINSAIIQAEFLSNYLRNADGLFISKTDISENEYGEPSLKDTDNPPSISEQALTMKAFTLLSNILNDDNYPSFKNIDLSLKSRSLADQIYSMFQESKEEIFNSKTRDLCDVISSSIFYCKSITHDNSDLLNYATILSLELESRVDMSGNLKRFPYENDLTSNSSCFLAMKTLIESYKTTDIYKFQNTAELLYKKLDLLWNPICSLYTLDDEDKFRYTLRDVGSVIAGLNSIRLFGNEFCDDARSKLISFFNTAVNNSGLVQSCIPPPQSDDCEGYLSYSRNNCCGVVHEDFCHYNIPLSKETNIAPVFAKKFTYKHKKQKFDVNSKSFYSDYALFMVNEILQMNYPQILL